MTGDLPALGRQGFVIVIKGNIEGATMFGKDTLLRLSLPIQVESSCGQSHKLFA